MWSRSAKRLLTFCRQFVPKFLADVHKLRDGSPHRPHAVIWVDRDLGPVFGGWESAQRREALKKGRHIEFLIKYSCVWRSAETLNCSSGVSPAGCEEGFEWAAGAAARCSSCAARWFPAPARRATPRPSSQLPPASPPAPPPAWPVVSQWPLSAWCRPERCSVSPSLWFSIDWNNRTCKFTEKTDQLTSF